MSVEAAGASGRPRRPDLPLAQAASAAAAAFTSLSGAATTPAPVTRHAPMPAWQDLAGNRAGSGAEERARAVRREAPVKTTFGRLLHLSTEETAWRLAAVGQRKVGLTLSRLGPAWRVLHSVPVGEDQADINHLVIGPPGLFTLTTKYRRGALVQVFGDSVRVDGDQMPYVAQARHEAWRAACLLTAACGYRIIVAPAIVMVGAEDVCVARPPEGVEILDRRHLLRWLTGLPVRLKPAHVNHIFSAARRSDTWLRRPVTMRRGERTEQSD
jgi:nuclease-like protein